MFRCPCNNINCVFVQRKDAPLFTCQEESGGDASFGLVSRVSIIFESLNIVFLAVCPKVKNSAVFWLLSSFCYLFDKQDLTKIGPNCEHLLRLTCSTTFRAPLESKAAAPTPSERNYFLFFTFSNNWWEFHFQCRFLFPACHSINIETRLTAVSTSCCCILAVIWHWICVVLL